MMAIEVARFCGGGNFLQPLSDEAYAWYWVIRAFGTALGLMALGVPVATVSASHVLAAAY